MSIHIPLIQFDHARDLPLPAYASDLAAGMDLLAAIDAPQTLHPMARVLVPTGIACAIPAGWEGQVRPRSGLAVREGITCLNSPGTIDADYRGEISVLLINLGDKPFLLERAMRIAQLVFAPVGKASWALVDALPGTVRGGGGFGSTGIK